MLSENDRLRWNVRQLDLVVQDRNRQIELLKKERERTVSKNRRLIVITLIEFLAILGLGWWVVRG